jgi:hypothetical protein
MSNFPTPLEEVIHHNVIKNNKTGGPALDIGPMQLLWRALGENTGYTFSIFETTVVPGMGFPSISIPLQNFSMCWKARYQLDTGTVRAPLSGTCMKSARAWSCNPMHLTRSSIRVSVRAAC